MKAAAQSLRFVFGGPTRPTSFWLNSLERQRPLTWVSAQQVHGSRVVTVDRYSAQLIPDCDSLLCCTPGLGLLMKTADCLPLVLSQDGGPWFGIVHAGWRGLANGVITSSLRVLQAQGVSLNQLRVWIGPHMQAMCYQVGLQVRERFGGVPLAIINNAVLNMVAVARFQLQQLGVSAGAIQVDKRCTHCDLALASHRRNATRVRNVTAAVRY